MLVVDICCCCKEKCAAACVWAGVSQLVFGASTAQLIDLGTKQIDISCQTVVQKSFQEIKVVGGILADECLELFRKL